MIFGLDAESFLLRFRSDRNLACFILHRSFSTYEIVQILVPCVVDGSIPNPIGERSLQFQINPISCLVVVEKQWMRS